jgi:hypothetical protein
MVATETQAMEQLGAGLHRQHLIEHQQIGTSAEEGRFEFLGTLEGADPPTFPFQTLSEEVAEDFVVIEDPYP